MNYHLNSGRSEFSNDVDTNLYFRPWSRWSRTREALLRADHHRLHVALAGERTSNSTKTFPENREKYREYLQTINFRHLDCQRSLDLARLFPLPKDLYLPSLLLSQYRAANQKSP